MLLALPYPTMSFLPFYAAEDLGFFSQYGLDIRCLHVSEKKGRKVKLCLAGDLEFYTSVSTTVEAWLRDWGDVKALCANTLTRHFCTARSGVKSLSDLKNKKVMVGGGASNNQILFLSKQSGWVPGKDLTIVSGDAGDRIRAFQDPTISAVIAREEYNHWALESGFHLIPYPEEYMRWHGGGFCTSGRLTREQPDLVYGAVKAVVQATDFVNGNRDAAVELGLKRIATLKRDDVEGNYDIIQKVGGYSCEISEGGIRFMSEVLGMVKGSAKKATLADVADLTFLQRARSELKAERASDTATA